MGGTLQLLKQIQQRGEGTWIGPNAVIFNGARIGKDCKIFPSAVISGIPQDLKFKGETSYTIIGDNTFFETNFVTVNRGTKSKEKTIIGKNCLPNGLCSCCTLDLQFHR